MYTLPALELHISAIIYNAQSVYAFSYNSTQDVHIGDAPNASYDGENVIQHVGAHNMIRTLNWVFKNFPDPTHIFLTGCSAGGT